MSYKIELTQSGVAGAKSSMFRCGIKFEVNEPQTLDLTQEELEIFKNDWRFKLSDSRDPGSTLEEAKIASREDVSQSVVDRGQEVVHNEVETVEDSVPTQKETVDNKVEELPFLDSLLKDFSREELNKQAKALGIKKAHTFENKTEVAQAIVDAQ